MKQTDNRGPTAAELIAELKKDPAYQARSAQEKIRLQHVARYQEEAAPLLAELAAVGHSVGSIGALLDSGREYRAAIPVLLDWLPRITYQPLKEDVIRALSIPWASPEAGPVLVREFQHTTDDELRWVLGNALETQADDSLRQELIGIATDRSFGRAREMVVLALAKLEPGTAVPVLIELLEDDTVVGHAVIALGKLRAASARAPLELLKDHPRTWVRQEVSRALRRIGTREADHAGS